jgi:threonine/homoserine efflux transporter RhtA
MNHLTTILDGQTNSILYLQLGILLTLFEYLQSTQTKEKTMTIILFDDAYAIVNGDKIIPIKHLPIDILLAVEKEGSIEVSADTAHNILYAR